MKTSQKTILYADDDAEDVSLLKEALQEVGNNYQLVEAFDGVHALEILNQMYGSNTLPCLIVLDINMPRMDGKQTLVAIQNHTAFAHIPIVLFSTSSSPLDKTFSQAKHVELITKPFEFNTLYQTATRLLSYCNA